MSRLTERVEAKLNIPRESIMTKRSRVLRAVMQNQQVNLSDRRFGLPGMFSTL